MTEHYVPIGYTKKVHGATGEIKAHVHEEYMDDLLRSNVIFIEVHGKPVPFFIENIREGGGLILKLEEVDTPQKASEYTSKEISLRQKDLLDDGDRPPIMSSLRFDRYAGFELRDKKQGVIGTILEVVEFPQQEMAIVNDGRKEIMVPLHEDLIVKVELEAKVLVMDLPAGILEI